MSESENTSTPFWKKSVRLPIRFSLRTLLIGTFFVACASGLWFQCATWILPEKKLGKHVTFAPDWKCYAQTDANGKTSVYDTASGQLLYALEGKTARWSGDVPGVKFSEDGQYLIRGIEYNGTRVSDVYEKKSGKLIGNIPFEPNSHSLEISSDGNWKVYSNSVSVSVHNFQTDKYSHGIYSEPYDSPTMKSAPGRAFVSPDRSLICTSTKDGEIKVYDVGSTTARCVLRGSDKIYPADVFFTAIITEP